MVQSGLDVAIVGFLAESGVCSRPMRCWLRDCGSRSRNRRLRSAKVGAGVYLTPNSVRHLQRIGLGPAVLGEMGRPWWGNSPLFPP